MLPPVALPRPPQRRGRGLREVLDTIALIVVVFAIVNLATVRFFIEGPSMQPSFHEGQFLIVSRLHYLFGEPTRGDIIVFDRPGDDDMVNDPLLIKRLIGLPGDHVQISTGETRVNGVLLNEPYINQTDRPFSCNANRIVPINGRDITPCDVVLGENEYFMMGDNRNNSTDSREFGIVTRDRIIGQAIFRYWPPQDFGSVWHYRFPEGE